jgi:hypothetical protein
MRMMEQFLSPGVKHHQPTDACAEALGIGRSAPAARILGKTQGRQGKPGEFPGRFKAVVRELSEAVPELAKLTDAAERRAEEQRRRWEEEEERRRREEAERRNREARKASIDQLLAIINRWGVARRIEDFFQEAELRAADSGRDDRDHLLARLRRARGLVGGTDPLGSLRPVALSG